MKVLKLTLLSLTISTALSADVTEATANFISNLQRNGTEGMQSKPMPVEQTWKRCAGCHGEFGQELANGSQKVVKDMSAENIEKALNGYTNESYGGLLKGLMRAQLMNVKKEDFKPLAEYIKTLSKNADASKSKIGK